MRTSIRFPSAHMMTLIVIAYFFSPPGTAGSQTKGVHPQPAPVAQAVRLTSAISVDGKLDEEVWHTAPAITEFRQSQPDEGKPATQKTEVRFAYDDQAIYVGARMFDSMGAKGVVTRLLRRDALSETDSDNLLIAFDSYHDHTSRYNFILNP